MPPVRLHRTDRSEVSAVSDVLGVIVQLSALVFVVSSMLAMGLSLTVPEIIAPLKNLRLVVLALAINFIAVPFIAWGIQAVMDLDQDIYTGLLLLATAAGAPFLPKLAQVANGNAAFSVGLMVLLMVVTVIYMPIVLPLFLSGVEINAWDIARSLIVLMLFPLGIGLFMKSRWPAMAKELQSLMSQASSIAILLLLVGAIILQWTAIVSLIGTGGLIAIAVFLLVSLALGYVAGGSDPAIRSIMGLGTAQRNVSAAMVVGAQNFSDSPNVLITVIVGALIGLVLLMPIAAELGKRTNDGDPDVGAT
jgi:BASS family bile acid:Na+ symporter